MRERRGVLVGGLATQVFKEISIWQLLCVSHVEGLRWRQPESSAQPSPGLNGSCLPFLSQGRLWL